MRMDLGSGIPCCWTFLEVRRYLLPKRIYHRRKYESRKKDRASICINSSTLPADDRERIRILHTSLTHLQLRSTITASQRQVVHDRGFDERNRARKQPSQRDHAHQRGRTRGTHPAVQARSRGHSTCWEG